MQGNVNIMQHGRRGTVLLQNSVADKLNHPTQLHLNKAISIVFIHFAEFIFRMH